MSMWSGGVTVAPSSRRAARWRRWLIDTSVLTLVAGLGLVVVGPAQATAQGGRATPASSGVPTTTEAGKVLSPRSEPRPHGLDRSRVAARLAHLVAAHREAAAEARRLVVAHHTQTRQQLLPHAVPEVISVEPQELTRAQRRQLAKVAQIEAAHRRALAAQQEATRRLRQALEALARALSTKQCTTVTGHDGQTATISCPLDVLDGDSDTDDDPDSSDPDSSDPDSSDPDSTDPDAADPGTDTEDDTGPASDSTPSAPTAAGLIATAAPDSPVTDALAEDRLAAALAAAIADWQGAGADTSGISARTGDLPGLTLGSTQGRTITIDADAGGWGWEAMHLGTVLRHEIGHAIGLGHTPDGLMAPSLAPGESRGMASAPAPPGAESEPGPESGLEPPAGPAEEPGPGPAASGEDQDQQKDQQGQDGAPQQPVEPAPEPAPEREPGTTTGTPGEVDEEAGETVPPEQPQPPAPPAPPAPPRPTWTVSGGTATLTIPEGALRGTLTYSASGNRLIFTTAAGQSASISLQGIGKIVVVGTDGADAVTVSLGGAPAGLTLALDGRSGTDHLTLAGGSPTSSYTATDGQLRVVRNGITLSPTGFEQLLDQGTGRLTVTVDGALRLTGGSGSPLRVTGLPGQVVLLVDAPQVAALFDALTAAVVLEGVLDWSDTATALELRGRTVTVRPGAAVDLGHGNLTLRATDTAIGDRSDASASVTVTGATLRGGDLTISATATSAHDAAGQYVGIEASSTARVVVRDSVLEAVGDVLLTATSKGSVTATATAPASHTDPRKDAATAGVLLASSAVVRLEGTGSVTAGGRLVLNADNTTDARASADASRAAAGAGVARALVERITRAMIEGPMVITVDALDVRARAGGTVSATSAGSRGGAIGNDVSPSDLTGGLARDLAGDIPSAAALSFSRLAGLAEAFLSPGSAGVLRITSAGEQKVSATGGGSVSADAVSTGGRGTAAAIAMSDFDTIAHLGGRLLLLAPRVVVTASNPAAETRADAGSPADGGGALAIGIARTLTTSTLDRGAVLASGPGAADVAFLSGSSAHSSAGTDARGSSPSLVVLVVDHGTTSTLGLGSDLVSPHDTTVAASTHDRSAASAGGSRGHAITLSTVTTTALVEDGPEIVGTGVLDVSAEQSAVARTTAAVLALTIARHENIARIDRAVDFGLSGVRVWTVSDSVLQTVVTPVTGTTALVVTDLVREALSTLSELRGVPPVTSVSRTVVQSAVLSGPPSSELLDVAHPGTVPGEAPVTHSGSGFFPATSGVSAVAGAGATGGGGGGGHLTSLAAHPVRRPTVVRRVRRRRRGRDLSVQMSRGPPAFVSATSSAVPHHPAPRALLFPLSSTTVGGSTTTEAGSQTSAFSPPPGSVPPSIHGLPLRVVHVLSSTAAASAGARDHVLVGGAVSTDGPAGAAGAGGTSAPDAGPSVELRTVGAWSAARVTGSRTWGTGGTGEGTCPVSVRVRGSAAPAPGGPGGNGAPCPGAPTGGCGRSDVESRGDSPRRCPGDRGRRTDVGERGITGDVGDTGKGPARRPVRASGDGAHRRRAGRPQTTHTWGTWGNTGDGGQARPGSVRARGSASPALGEAGGNGGTGERGNGASYKVLRPAAAVAATWRDRGALHAVAPGDRGRRTHVGERGTGGKGPVRCRCAFGGARHRRRRVEGGQEHSPGAPTGGCGRSGEERRGAAPRRCPGDRSRHTVAGGRGTGDGGRGSGELGDRPVRRRRARGWSAPVPGRPRTS